jgi:DNA-3-methyladenine glycosylase
MARLDKDFFARPTLVVAKELLGKYMVFNGKVGRIVETEAYLGPTDLGSHARAGLTKRTSIMFGPPGHAYVYVTYGMHYMLNITAEADSVPGAVLIRALEPVEGIDLATNGPGRLTKALGINLSHNGMDLSGPDFFVEEDRGDKIGQIVRTPRIGINYAGDYMAKPWRFFIKGNKFVSKL